MPSGLVLDFSNMLGEERLQDQEVTQALAEQGAAAALAVQAMRETGCSKAHLSKDGTPEHVYFSRMPYIQEGNPNTVDSIAKLKEYSEYLKQIDVVVFLGVGGSYLGNKVLFDAFGGCHWNTNASLRHGQPRIYFSGNNLDPVDCNGLVYEVQRLAYLHLSNGRELRVMLVPISKSGTTLETISAFTYFYDTLSKGLNIKLECTVVTDLQAEEDKAPLLQLARRYGWWQFDIKEGIGGRFCVMTDPGLITMAALGGDIEVFLRGAREMDEYCQSATPAENPALLNALLKFLAYGKGRDIEVFMPYSMHLKSLSEWYVQLLAESLGKRLNRNGQVVNYGRTPIVAVEGGTVGAMGWNQYGGWRIGIRSHDRLRYYYYAHLRKDTPFAPGLEVGDTVQAGDVIGFMGRTGYSVRENVNNIEVVHLHFGLQLVFDESQKECNSEIWVDVYDIVNFLAQHRSSVQYDPEAKAWKRLYPYRDLD